MKVEIDYVYIVMTPGGIKAKISLLLDISQSFLNKIVVEHLAHLQAVSNQSLFLITLTICNIFWNELEEMHSCAASTHSYLLDFP